MNTTRHNTHGDPIEAGLERLAERDRAACPTELADRIADRTSLAPLRLAADERDAEPGRGLAVSVFRLLAPITAAAAVLAAGVFVLAPSRQAGLSGGGRGDDVNVELAFYLDAFDDERFAIEGSSEIALLAMEIDDLDSTALVDDSWELPQEETP